MEADSDRKKQITTFSHDEAKIYLYLKKFLPNFLRLLDPMPNIKSADYAFSSKKGPILVEVENIDLVADKIVTVSDLDKFVTYRTKKKLTEKLDNLPSDWNHSFYLVQIIWGDNTQTV